MPNDFKVKSQYGKGLDWPISYEELSPYYDRIAEAIGVSGDAAAERRWHPIAKDYPMPPLKSFRHGDIFIDAFKKAGIPLAPMPTGINSTEYKGRPACIYDGWCHVGCPTGAHAIPQFLPSEGCARQGRGAAAVQLRRRACSPTRAATA